MVRNKTITFKQAIGSITEEQQRRILARDFPDEKAHKDWSQVSVLFHKKDNQKLLNAYNFSKQVNYQHKGVSSEIYFAHPLRVATLVSILSKMRSIDYPILGLLHNIVETSNVSITNLSSTFGESITGQILTLTVDRTIQWDKHYKREYYERINQQPHSCRAVKIMDKFDNLFLLYTNPDNEIKKRYLNEIENYILPMMKRDLPQIEYYFSKLMTHCKQTALN